MVTKQAISFLGNVDSLTGIIIDPAHELFGQCIAGKVLIFPGGKGSTVGSYVIYQLKKRNLSPSAMTNLHSEPIVAVGAIISGIPPPRPASAWAMGRVMPPLLGRVDPAVVRETLARALGVAEAR